MPIPPESIQVGQCYLMLDGEVRRVLRLLPNEGVHYESRAGMIVQAFGWKPGVLARSAFAALIDRPVPCDWTPESDEAWPTAAPP
jgi:hypothetical protein